MAGRLFGSRRDGYDCGGGRQEAWQVSGERLPRDFWLGAKRRSRAAGRAGPNDDRMHRQERRALPHLRTHHARDPWSAATFLRGRTLAHTVQPEDYVHLIVACLLHDIGFVRGVLSGDTKTEFVIDKNGETVTLPRGASDASLAALSCRSIQVVRLRTAGKSTTIDPARVAAAIELTRFPPSPNSDSDNRARAEAGSSRRSDRAAWRSPLSEKGECAVLRVRGTRQQPAVWLRVSCRPRREVSGILLEHRLGASRGGDEISEPDGLWPPVDRQPAQSYFQRRAFQLADGPADLTVRSA